LKEKVVYKLSLVIGNGNFFVLTKQALHLLNDERREKGVMERKLTMTSAITLGCLRGLRRNARNLVKITTRHI